MKSVLVDTSVAVPLVVADHDDHLQFTRHLARVELGLADHASADRCAADAYRSLGCDFELLA